MDDWRRTARTDGSQRLFDDAAAARRFQRRLREVAPSDGHGRPALHYDESGYPIEDRASLAARVRRLITG
ncbi:MAG TPA: hypothetical protein VF517_18610 [Thermoleophilaceae bacterium]